MPQIKNDDMATRRPLCRVCAVGRPINDRLCLTCAVALRTATQRTQDNAKRIR